MIPGGTYRIQLHAGFGFEDAGAIASYLADLGVTHLYCSPYLQAAPGSSHGYDVVDPLRLSEDLGGALGHTGMVRSLGESSLGHIVDIVPNHMAATPSNPWWWDVLENGPQSRYAHFFDIDWEGHGEASPRKVLVPILADHYGRILDQGALAVGRVDDRIELTYENRRLPLSPPSLSGVLAAVARKSGDTTVSALAGSLRDSLPVASERREFTTRLRVLLGEREDLRNTLDDELRGLNDDRDRLDDVLSQQNYRLAYWRVANEELDYRRFFNIESLVGIRVEDPDVFVTTHELVLSLVREGTVSGLRVDHVDGLRDPGGYLRRLREESGDAYLVVEKILEPGEALPDSWPVAGTTGYDFMTRVNQLFVDRDGESQFTKTYSAFTGESGDYGEVVLAAKRWIMQNQLAAEIHRLTDLLDHITSAYRRHRDHTRRDLREAIVELISRYDVYRTYVAPGGRAGPADREHVSQVISRLHGHVDRELVELLGDLATGDARESESEREFTQRLQQVTAPVMAKGVEDTAFYRYNRLVSLNEVGGDPGTFGETIDRFHEAATATAERWPDTMNALTTHDTKRSADVRARLNVLSELPGAWSEQVERWASHNERHRVGDWPDRNTEYLLYQTILGAWPIGADRVVEFMLKAVREARVHTSWVAPDSQYEQTLERLIRAALSDQEFVSSVVAFLDSHRIVLRGRRNSLAQVALAMTAPGVPDTYQGDELWNLSLVDPDNRRPVDYELRGRLLGSHGPRPEAIADDADGLVKLGTLRTLLKHRGANPVAYRSSCYEPLEVMGGDDEILAFRRGPMVSVVAVRSQPVLVGRLELPAGVWHDLMTGATREGGSLRTRDLIGDLPFAVLVQS